VIIYNLTELHRGTNYISEPLEMLVWAMDDGGKPPVAVCAYIDGKLFPLKSIINDPLEKNEIHEKCPEITLPPNELSFNLELKCDGNTVRQQNESYFLDGQVLKTPAEIGNYLVTISDDESSHFNGHLPEGMNPRYLYAARIELSPGVKRVRIVAIDRHRRMHWVHGFSVNRIGRSQIEAPTKEAIELKTTWAQKIVKLPKLVSTKLSWLYQWMIKSILVRLLKVPRYADRWSLVILINPERLGHFVANTEIYLAEKKCGLHLYPENKPIFFITRHTFVEDHGWIDIKGNVANATLLQLWKQKFKVIREGFISKQMVDQIRQSMPGVVHQHRPHGHRDLHGCLDRSVPSVKLTKDQLKNGEAFLSAQGIPSDAKIILFHYRTPEFVGGTYRNIGAALESVRYQYRNTDANSYKLALDWLLSRGYYVIRMGKEKDAWSFKHPHAFDYASFRMGDSMDLYLFSR
jgi:hypothetical protein